MRHILVCILILFFATSFARTISGVVIDEKDKEPLVGVYVTLSDDSISGKHAVSNGNGWFILRNVHEQDVTLSLVYNGYESLNISIELSYEDTDMGEILMTPQVTQLNELVVTGTRVNQRADKYIILPTTAEIDRASESVGLLSEMKVKMPGLQVNEFLQRVTIDGGAVIFQINGKEESFSKIRTLNHHDILRIEYRNTPDIRYADRGAAGVINFVLKPRDEGGSLMVQSDNALTTLRSNTNISGTYYYKKSEWSLDFGNIWRKSTKQYTVNDEDYIGRENTISRRLIGIPSSSRDFSNNVALGYTYMHNPGTMFMARLKFNSKDVTNNNYNRVKETEGERTSQYDKYNPNKTKATGSSMDLYFRKNLDKTQTLELNASGAMSSGDYTRGMHYSYDNGTKYDQTNYTDNSSWATAVEAFYTLSFDNVTTSYGINYSHNHTSNKYSENGAQFEIDRLIRDNIYFYGNVVGNVKKFGYTLGIGGKYYHNDGNSGNDSYLRFKAVATLNYRVNKHWSLNYMYMYSPEMPSLAAMNDEAHTIDDISIQVGNINIKPSIYQRNRLYILYNTGNFYATAWGSYSRTSNPINSVWYYEAEPADLYYRMFINKVENGNYTDNISTQLDLSYQNLFDHLTLSATVGWDRFVISDVNEYNTLHKVKAGISANAYFGNWTIFANYTIAPGYSLDGRTFCREIRSDYFGAKYRWRHFSFGLQFTNMFTRKGFYQETRTPSLVRPITSQFYIKDFANLIELNIVYRVNFGKDYNTAKRTLYNGGVDTGVDVRY